MTAAGRIAKHHIVTMQYRLSTGNGALIRAATEKPVQYVHGLGSLFPKLEAALEGHTVGDVVHVRLLPDDAFGKRDLELLHELPAEDVPPGELLVVGGILTGHDEAGNPVNFRITAIDDGWLKLDGNHRLAGETLVFEIEIQAVRPATPAEIDSSRPQPPNDVFRE